MKLLKFNKTAFLFTAIILPLTIGCNKAAEEKTNSESKQNQVSNDKDGHDHSGWWCKEHGIPEEECSMCSDKYAAKCKADDDWCEEHNRAESQCFICNPEKAKKYAALYKAKFGKEPPKPTE